MSGWFNEAYRATPPWDIGHRQGAIALLERERRIGRRVLDVGCGTGDNALYLARHGHDVLGIDSAPLAIERAQAKSRAERRGGGPRFAVHDALELGSLAESFDTVIDCGFFHTLSDRERAPFAAGLRQVLAEGGVYFMLCFSEHETGWGGPRRIRAAEIFETFREDRGFRVEAIDETRFETRLPGWGPRAYLARVRRVRPATSLGGGPVAALAEPSTRERGGS
jgi:SAM-dependent methyltransferase